MFNQDIHVLSSSDFKRALDTVITHTRFDELPGITLKEFATRDHFYRPADAEFMDSFTDQQGNTVSIYGVDFSRSMLVLSRTPKGYIHSLYTTTDDRGFYINELFELITLLKCS